jgi:hypothetical protein
MLNKLREMIGEEPAIVTPEARLSEEIPEDTPYYLNPEVLREQGEVVAYDAEEPVYEPEKEPIESHVKETVEEETGSIFQRQPPEKLEEVLDSGMQFISGLLEMATGQKLKTVEDEQRMIRIDKETGEVTMKFRLPGF